MNTGDLSTLLVWAAATAFTLALVAYAVDLARLADNAQRLPQAVPEREPVAVGASVAQASGPRAADSAVAGSSDEVAPGRSPRAEGIARSTTYLGIVLLAAAIVLRGVAAGRWPTANMYEFTLVGVLVATTVLAVVQRRRVIAFLGVVVMGIGVSALVLALESFFVKADAVRPALQNYWLVLHVGVAITATGVFTVAFVLWTLTLIGGAIWAEDAWGRYWNWDPKEVGTFIAWVLYAAYLHARTTRGWTGRRAAYLVFVGYAAVIANFTVVNLVVDGLHSYAF